MKRECLFDLSSECKLPLESGDLFLDLSGNLDGLLDDLVFFATDLVYLKNHPESGFLQVGWPISMYFSSQG